MKCPECPLEFDNQLTLVSHLTQDHNYEWPEIEAWLESISKPEDHIVPEHKDTLAQRKRLLGKPCKYCGKKVTDLSNFGAYRRNMVLVPLHRECAEKLGMKFNDHLITKVKDDTVA